MTELAAFAEHEFRLGKRDKSGTSLRETLQTVERMTGRMPPEGVNPVEFPQAVSHLWQWFMQLSNARQPGMGVSPITYPDLHAFFSLYGITPDGWELDAIRVLDGIALESMNDKK